MKTKKILNFAKEYAGQSLTGIYLLPLTKEYHGFCGKSGFTQLMVLGFDEKNNLYKLTTNYKRDLLVLPDFPGITINVERATGFIRVYFNHKVTCNMGEAINTLKFAPIKVVATAHTNIDVLKVDKKGFKQLQKVLANPPKPNKNLQKLMQK